MENQKTLTVTGGENSISIKTESGFKTVIDGQIHITKDGISIVKNTK